MSDVFDLPQDKESMNEALKRLAEETVSTERLVKDLEANLDEVKKRLNKLKSVDLPDKMAECGFSSLELDDGTIIKVEEFLSGSLPKEPEKRDAAICWLEDHDAAALIKTELKIDFQKSQHNEAMSLANELHERGFDANATMGVHPQTLLAHVRERLRKGEEVPLEVLGIYAGRVAKVKLPKGA